MINELVDDFLAGLESDKSQEFASGDRIVKILMSAQDNQGTVVIAPFKNPTGKFYNLLEGVREYNTVCSMFRNGEASAWIKILPKNAYGELSPEDAALHQEVAGLFDELYDKLNNENPNAWQSIRVRKYSLFQGVLLKHINRNNDEIKDNKDKAVVLIFPSKAPIDAMATAVNAKINTMGGSKEWIPAVFSPTPEGRDGVMSITFKKPASPGYDAQVGFEFNSSYVTLVDRKGFPEDVVKLFGDPVEDFLGWQNGKNSKFNRELFVELKAALRMALKSPDAPSATPTPTENKNGIDPMLAQTDAKPTPIEVPTPGAIKGSNELPF